MTSRMPRILFNDVTIFDGERTMSNQSVLTQGQYIKSVQPSDRFSLRSNKEIEIVDGSGFFLCPGFIDSHIHILSYAASIIGVDLSDVKGLGINAFREALGNASHNVASGDWLRCYSLEAFDESLATALIRDFLDQVVPDIPTIIRFNSGHGCLLNSLAMEKVGLTNTAEEPTGVTFGRNLKDGLLDGMLFEADEFLDSRTPKLKTSEIRSALTLANTSFIEKGITTIVDASENNDVTRFEFISNVISAGILKTGIVFMPGYSHFSEFRVSNDIQRFTNSDLKMGPVKIMLRMSSGEINPSYGELERITKECHDRGFPVAIHAVEQECVSHAINILSTGSMQGDRLEHVSELSDQDLDRLRRLSVGVSTQPGFIYVNGDRYMRQSTNDKLTSLYRLRSMIDAGVLVGVSSDAPVIKPDPFIALHSACNRETLSGAYLNPGESISPSDFLRSITSSNAELIGLNETKGRIKEGYQADLVLLDVNPTFTPGDDLKAISVMMTVIKGDIVYRSR